VPATTISSRISIKNILFTTDFSEAAAGALPYVRALAKWFDARVVIAHSAPALTALALPLEPIPPKMDLEWESAQSRMKEFIHSNPLPGLHAEAVVCRGEIGNTLADLVERHQIDLVVVGSRGREGMRKLMLGSGAEQIFRRARCPVLTVGPNVQRTEVECESWKNILFATDFSEGSLEALPYALSIAEENQAQLTLAHMVSLVPIERQSSVVEAIKQRLWSVLPADAADWCTAECVVRFEFPSDGILRIAEQRCADLIVMGVHKSNAPRASSHLPWAIAYEVVCHAKCPVLTVRG
jgi:nucleotide-binding universal stress UspA family protein